MRFRQLNPICQSQVWAVAVMFSSATCSLQFAKASAATLSQQDEDNSANLVRKSKHIRLYLYSGKKSVVSLFIFSFMTSLILGLILIQKKIIEETNKTQRNVTLGE
jgi:hypothetical protein